MSLNPVFWQFAGCTRQVGLAGLDYVRSAMWEHVEYTNEEIGYVARIALIQWCRRDGQLSRW